VQSVPFSEGQPDKQNEIIDENCQPFFREIDENASVNTPSLDKPTNKTHL
jgi:hypothetical protein